MRQRRRKQLVYCAVIFVSTMVIVFVKRNFYNGHTCFSPENKMFGKSSDVPKHIHQLFFNVTNQVIPDRLENARRSWIKQHSGFQYTLWNTSMIDTLIQTKYPLLKDLYYSYGHWIRRADVARYVVLHEFGGIYIDLDIKSTGRQLRDLYNTFKKTTSVVLYLTNPPIVSNDFMISKPHHTFLKHVLCGLEAANKWYILPYITTMFTTGPAYLHSQYKSYNQTSEIELLEPSVMSKYVRHIRGSSWHQWDGVILWWIFTHKTHVVYIVFILFLFLTLVLVLTWKNRKLLLMLKRFIWKGLIVTKKYYMAFIVRYR